MSVIGPKAKCSKCDKRLAIDKDGKMPWHNAKGTSVPCTGSRERPRV